MTGDRLVSCGSQTVGPYFRIGLEYLIERTPEVASDALGTITIRGRVLDRDGVTVPDALLEFWSATDTSASQQSEFPEGFRRVATDENGAFSVAMKRAMPAPMKDGRMQSPHMLVLVFARGLLRHLISRVYLDDEDANGSDPVLLTLPAERRSTLIAKSDGQDQFRWNVVLQGSNETVFFAW
jgi:protocatechuate 3,4-dioxygenase, alpha subunit